MKSNMRLLDFEEKKKVHSSLFLFAHNLKQLISGLPSILRYIILNNFRHVTVAKKLMV